MKENLMNQPKRKRRYFSNLIYLLLTFFDNFRFKKNRLFFVFRNAFVLFGLILIFYLIYGHVFFCETYLYHLEQKDNRHDYSLYFYYKLIYSKFEDIYKAESIVLFLP